MVGILDVDPELLQCKHRLAPEVGACIQRREVEVAATVQDLRRSARVGRPEVEVFELGTDVELLEAHRAHSFQ